jgi:MFS family permease
MRSGSKLPLLLGTACAALSFAFLSFAHAAQWQLLVATALLGLGIGLSFASMANLIVEAVPQEQTGEATGMNTIMRTVGGAFGAQIAAAIITNNLAAGSTYPAEEGYSEAFLISAAALCLALLAAFMIPGRGAGAAAQRDVVEAPARG